MMLQSKYDLGQIVYLKTDKEQCARMVISISFRPTGVIYELNYGSVSSWHYEIEVSDEKDVLASTTVCVFMSGGHKHELNY
jgi:hypothetical protein